MYEHKHLMQIVGAIAVLMLSVGQSFAENIDPYEDGSQYAYGENVGWLNFEPSLCVTGVL